MQFGNIERLNVLLLFLLNSRTLSVGGERQINGKRVIKRVEEILLPDLSILSLRMRTLRE